jgi:hypothetical protein
MNNSSINDILNDIQWAPTNQIKNFMINVLLNPAMEIDRNITVPPTPLGGIETRTVVKLIDEIKDYIPEFLKNTNILPQPIPEYEKQTLHFVKSIPYQKSKFISIFKIHLKYEGGGTPIKPIENPEKYFPGFQTNKLYYESAIIPVNNIQIKNNEIISFQPRIYEKGLKKIETDEKMFLGSEIFDEQDFSSLNREIMNSINPSKDEYHVIADYFPIKFQYSTISLNLLNPTEKNITKYLPIFDKIIKKILDKEEANLYSDSDISQLKQLCHLYNFNRKVNINKDIYWEIKENN